jgi:hypothetical protein
MRLFSLPFLLLAIVFGVVLIAAVDHTGPGKPDTREAHEVATEVVRGLSPRPEWLRVDVETAEPSAYAFDLIYKQPPRGEEAGARADATMIVESCLKALIARGHRPATENIAVQVSVRQEGLAGVTGEPLVRVFGLASYNYVLDRIDYDPAS